MESVQHVRDRIRRVELMSENTYHVYPVGDLIKHDTSGEDCVCGSEIIPVKLEDGSITWMIVHASLDGRELREEMFMASLEFPKQDRQQNAKTVEQIVGCLLIEGASAVRKLADAKAAFEAGDEAKLRSIFSTAQPTGYDDLRMLVYRCFDRSAGEATSYG